MSKSELLGAEFGVFVRALALTAVGYGVYSVFSEAVFISAGTVYVVGGIALLLLVATNVAYLYAKRRRPELLSTAESVQASVDGDE